jgi:hypothetical protein
MSKEEQAAAGRRSATASNGATSICDDSLETTLVSSRIDGQHRATPVVTGGHDEGFWFDYNPARIPVARLHPHARASERIRGEVITPPP